MDSRPEDIEEVKLDIKGRVAIITINQPKKLGALSQDLFFHLSQLMRHVDGRDDIFITVLTGTGRFFSAGADVSVAGQNTGPQKEQYKQWLQTFAAYNLNITQAFYSHRKILVTALNGPVVGIAAALISHSDFIYAAPHAYLLCPFTSLGLVAEGLASRAMLSRLGPARGPEALLMSKRISCEEMVQCGFVNKMFNTTKEDSAGFLKQVLEEVDNRLGEHLVPDSLVKIKALMRGPDRDLYDAMGAKEIFSGLEVFMKGVSTVERGCTIFARLLDLLDPVHSWPSQARAVFCTFKAYKRAATGSILSSTLEKHVLTCLPFRSHRRSLERSRAGKRDISCNYEPRMF